MKTLRIIVLDQFDKVRDKEKWSEVKVEAKKCHRQCFFNWWQLGGTSTFFIQALRKTLVSGIEPELKGDTNAASDGSDITKAKF